MPVKVSPQSNKTILGPRAVDAAARRGVDRGRVVRKMVPIWGLKAKVGFGGAGGLSEVTVSQESSELMFSFRLLGAFALLIKKRNACVELCHQLT